MCRSTASPHWESDDHVSNQRAPSRLAVDEMGATSFNSMTLYGVTSLTHQGSHGAAVGSRWLVLVPGPRGRPDTVASKWPVKVALHDHGQSPLNMTKRWGGKLE